MENGKLNLTPLLLEWDRELKKKQEAKLELHKRRLDVAYAEMQSTLVKMVHDRQFTYHCYGLVHSTRTKAETQQLRKKFIKWAKNDLNLFVTVDKKCTVSIYPNRGFFRNTFTKLFSKRRTSS